MGEHDLLLPAKLLPRSLQSTRASDPFVALYLPSSHATHVPAGHSVHADPSCPVYPDRICSARCPCSRAPKLTQMGMLVRAHLRSLASCGWCACFQEATAHACSGLCRRRWGTGPCVKRRVWPWGAQACAEPLGAAGACEHSSCMTAQGPLGARARLLRARVRFVDAVRAGRF